MRIQALVSFSGKIAMTRGEVRDISDLSLAQDLVRAGHCIEVKAKDTHEETPKTETPKRKGKKKDGS